MADNIPKPPKPNQTGAVKCSPQPQTPILMPKPNQTGTITRSPSVSTKLVR